MRARNVQNKVKGVRWETAALNPTYLENVMNTRVTEGTKTNPQKKSYIAPNIAEGRVPVSKRAKTPIPKKATQVSSAN